MARRALVALALVAATSARAVEGFSFGASLVAFDPRAVAGGETGHGARDGGDDDVDAWRDHDGDDDDDDDDDGRRRGRRLLGGDACLKHESDPMSRYMYGTCGTFAKKNEDHWCSREVSNREWAFDGEVCVATDADVCCVGDEGSIAGVAVGTIIGIALVVTLCAWCCKCCCFSYRNAPRVVAYAQGGQQLAQAGGGQVQYATPNPGGGGATPYSTSYFPNAPSTAVAYGHPVQGLPQQRPGQQPPTVIYVQQPQQAAQYQQQQSQYPQYEQRSQYPAV